MSLHSQLFRTFLGLALVMCGSIGNAQGIFDRHDDPSDVTSFYDPLCDLDTCWFEPINCDCPDQRPLNSGWFFDYSRTYVTVSRSREVPGQLNFDPGVLDGSPINSSYVGGGDTSGLGDWTWGNRYDFGYMSEAGTGLWFVARKIDNPNARESTTNIDINAADVDRLDGNPVGPTFVTLNGFQMWGFELNKVWRLEPTPSGAILEPYLGPRYVRIRDKADRTDAFSDPFDFPLSGTVGELLMDRVSFAYADARVTTDNDLFGGQFGMRSRWRRGRWHVTSDVRGILFNNHQTREIRQITEIQRQDFQANYVADGLGGGILGGVAAVGPLVQSEAQTTTYDSANTFVYGGEYRLDTAFEITKGFAVNFGGEIIAFADGIGRGRFGTDESVVLAGFNFGFTLNR